MSTLNFKFKQRKGGAVWQIKINHPIKSFPIGRDT